MVKLKSAFVIYVIQNLLLIRLKKVTLQNDPVSELILDTINQIYLEESHDREFLEDLFY
jgi:hypothetical protein